MSFSLFLLGVTHLLLVLVLHSQSQTNFKPMSNLELETIGIPRKEGITLYAPGGTKSQLEELRRVNGFRSINQVILTLIKDRCELEGI